MSWTEELIRLILPEGMLEEFELRRIEEKEGEIYLYLDELVKAPKLPEEYKGRGIRSKGLTRPTKIQDFPLRDKKCILVIRRRKWKITGVKELIISELELNKDGTRLTRGFADFLKAAGRVRASGTRSYRTIIQN
jgi:hypothetical protein